MMLPPPSDGFLAVLRRASATLLPAGALVAAGWALLASGTAPRPLHATDLDVVDTDGDGLPDRQEVVLGTDPLLLDTDYDGFSDGEEMALQTDPTLFDDTPTSRGLSIGMSARGEGGKLLLFIAAHLDDGVLDDKVIRVGCLASGKILKLPWQRLQPYMVTTEVQAPNGGLLYTIDLQLPQEFLHLHGAVTYFAVIGVNGQTRYAAAAKADLSVKDGVILLRRNATPSGGPGAIPEGGSTIHHPIPPDGEVGIPIDWEPGKICFQLSEVVGTVGPMVIHQVIQAECEDGWDTYCESDCPATVGSTFETVDPGALLGG